LPGTLDIEFEGRVSEESLLEEACLACGAAPVAPDDVASLGTAALATVVRFLLALCSALASCLAEAVGCDVGSVSALARVAPGALDELGYRSRRNSGDSNFPSSHDVFPSAPGARGDPAGDAAGGDARGADELAEEILASVEGDEGASEVDEILEGVERDVAEEASERARRRNRRRSGRRPSGRRPGGQPGHEGHGFRVPDEYDDLGEEVLVDARCESCPNLGRCLGGARLSGAHSVFDIGRITFTRKRVRTASMDCPLLSGPVGAADVDASTAGDAAVGGPAGGGTVLSGEFPEGARAMIRS